MSEGRTRRESLAWRLWQRLPLLVVLVVLWMLLWGEISLLAVTSGIAVAVIVTTVFYLPPVELSGRFNPFRLLLFIVRFAGDVVTGSILVAASAFAPRPIRRNAIIGVKLRTTSDFVMTMTATTVSLVPGTLVIEIDRARAILYLHSVGIADEEGVERVRRSALATEARIVRAIGSASDLAKVRR